MKTRHISPPRPAGRCLGDLISAVRAVTRTGASWAETADLVAGQATPVHDHVTWCVFGVIAGAEYEERYVLRDDGWLHQDGVTVNATGDVAGLAPPGDIHRVRNSGSQTAISLHIYGTDIGRLGSSVRHVYDLPIVATRHG
jgi:predicted metal-dependent enzyme (double-stranded beta helix superfamily)